MSVELGGEPDSAVNVAVSVVTCVCYLVVERWLLLIGGETESDSVRAGLVEKGCERLTHSQPQQ